MDFLLLSFWGGICHFWKKINLPNFLRLEWMYAKFKIIQGQLKWHFSSVIIFYWSFTKREVLEIFNMD